MTNKFGFYRLKARLRNSFLNINCSTSLGFLTVVVTNFFGTQAAAGADGQGASSEPGVGFIVMAAVYVLASALARFILVHNALGEAKKAI